MMMPSIFGENLFDDFDSWFSDPVEKRFFGKKNPLYGKHAKNLMKTDVRETKDSYEVDVDLPGFKKDEIKIELENGYLTISAAKGLDKDETDKETGKYIRRERYAGACQRSFYVGEDVTEQGIKVKYMHHEVDTFERMEIIKDLRLGSIDVVVGINLLREGLDLPEVSLVAILDADKEGFLRSETSLIQTIGRAARNAEALVIMYADEVTDSMERAITETERRRAIQMADNEEHGIVPKTIVKAIADSIEISDKAENAKRNTRRMGKLEREAAIERLTREMKEAAKLLEFEHAAFLRDQIDRLRRGENPTVDSDAETERRQNHAQTQRRGRKYLGKR